MGLPICLQLGRIGYDNGGVPGGYAHNRAETQRSMLNRRSRCVGCVDDLIIINLMRGKDPDFKKSCAGYKEPDF